MNDEHGRPDDGAELAAEARRLLGALQGWAQHTFPAPPSGHPGPECQWCPLCQFASVLRGEHPELADRVTEAGTALVGAMKALVETAGRTPKPPRRGDRPRPQPAPRVQHIRLDEPGEQ